MTETKWNRKVRDPVYQFVFWTLAGASWGRVVRFIVDALK